MSPLRVVRCLGEIEMLAEGVLANGEDVVRYK